MFRSWKDPPSFYRWRNWGTSLWIQRLKVPNLKGAEPTLKSLSLDPLPGPSPNKWCRPFQEQTWSNDWRPIRKPVLRGCGVVTSPSSHSRAPPKCRSPPLDREPHRAWWAALKAIGQALAAVTFWRIFAQLGWLTWQCGQERERQAAGVWPFRPCLPPACVEESLGQLWHPVARSAHHSSVP